MIAKYRDRKTTQKKLCKYIIISQLNISQTAKNQYQYIIQKYGVTEWLFQTTGQCVVDKGCLRNDNICMRCGLIIIIIIIICHSTFYTYIFTFAGQHYGTHCPTVCIIRPLCQTSFSGTRKYISCDSDLDVLCPIYLPRHKIKNT